MTHGASSFRASEFHPALDGSWRVDRLRSSLEFRTRSLWGLVAVRGRFEDWDGWLDLAGSPAIEVRVGAASLETGNRRRDVHLRSADFLDSERHPWVRFVSESAEPDGPADDLRVHGHLSARGRSVALDMPVRVRRIGGELELTAAVTVPHTELGMTWNWLGTISAWTKVLIHAHLVPEDSLAPGRHDVSLNGSR